MNLSPLLKPSRLLWQQLPPATRQRLARVVPMEQKRSIQRKISRDLSTESDVVRVSDGRAFVSTTDRVFSRVLWHGDYEAPLTAAVRRLVGPGQVAVDAGANFGWYTTLLAQLVGPAGHVYSFEPESGARSRLIANVELNNQENIVSVLPHAVGAARSLVTMQVAADTETALAYAVEADETAGSAAIEVRTLDETLDTHPEVAFIKLDIEGYETEALRGAKSVLHRPNPPVIQIEVNEEALQRAGSSTAELIATLDLERFVIAGADANGTLFRALPAGVMAPGQEIPSDIFAIPVGRSEEVLGEA